jgi:anti-sigma regulatory factor (Ser/Thr protein kinase)
MQTAKTGKKSMLEGLNAGAHYYLSKPYDQQTLIAIVLSAIRDYNHVIRMQKSLKESAQTLNMMNKGTFNFKSIDEGRALAGLLAKACLSSENVVLCLTELMTNAVEHGNLGITYKEKSRLNLEGKWESEVLGRLASPTYKDKFATVQFERGRDEITFTISDQGEGFDWQQYMEMSPERAFDSHGRGIALANSMSFKQVEYHDNGKKVCVTVPFSE